MLSPSCRIIPDSCVAAVALGEAGDEFGLGVDLEMLENDLRVAVDGIDAEAKVSGDFFRFQPSQRRMRTVRWRG